MRTVRVKAVRWLLFTFTMLGVAASVPEPVIPTAVSQWWNEVRLVQSELPAQFFVRTETAPKPYDWPTRRQEFYDNTGSALVFYASQSVQRLGDLRTDNTSAPGGEVPEVGEPRPMDLLAVRFWNSSSAELREFMTHHLLWGVHSKEQPWSSPGLVGNVGMSSWSFREEDHGAFRWMVLWRRDPVVAFVMGHPAGRSEAEWDELKAVVYYLDAKLEGFQFWGRGAKPAILVAASKTRPVASRVNAAGTEVALDQALALLGGTIGKSSAKEVQFTVGGREVTVAFGTRTATVAGRQVKLPSPARHYEHGITVPLQLLAEATGQPIALKRADGRQLAEARPARAPG